MIVLQELITAVRYRIKDMQGSSTSDHELADAINKSIKLLYTHLGENFVYSAAKKAILMVTNNQPVLLPLDYHAVRLVKTEDGARCLPTPSTPKRPFEYRIMGDYFEAIDGTYILEYYFVPSTQNMSNGRFDIPERILPYLVEIVAAVLANAPETAEAVVNTCVHVLAAGNISHFEDTGPVQVWGGKG